MSRFLVVVVILVLLAADASEVRAVDDETTIRRIWDEYMLRGEGGSYLSGEHKQRRLTDSFSSARGSVALASLTARGISASDLRGIAWFGLAQGIGWSIAGGLLEQLPFDAGLLELYGRRVVYNRGGFLGFDTYHKDEDERYEFLLLHRSREGARATVLHTWVVQRGPGSVHGFLTYDPTTRTATVRADGPMPEFVASVKIPSLKPSD